MKLLAIGNEKDFVNSLCFEFQNQGYGVDGCALLSEAKKICVEKSPDIIVSDHFLADGNVFDFLDQIKEQNLISPPPVLIVFESSQDPIGVDVAFAMGAWAYFKKPFSIRSLYESVEDAVFSRRAGYTKRLDERIEMISRLEFQHPKTGETISCSSNNISFGGFFVVLTNPVFKQGTPIHFKLIFTDEHFIEGQGTVAWIKTKPDVGEQMGFGVQFSGNRER
jgi:DNA-binding response OmpR family regulator